MAVDDIVLMRDENAPPQHWPMGKIAAVYPGLDGLVRNVSVRGGGKVYEHAVQGLIPLLTEEEDAEGADGQGPAP